MTQKKLNHVCCRVIFSIIMLIPMTLRATDATWIGNTSNSLTTAANWSGGVTPDGTATFNAAGTKGYSLSLQIPYSLETMNFTNLDVGPYPGYLINVINSGSLTLGTSSGSGIIDNSPSGNVLLFANSTNLTFNAGLSVSTGGDLTEFLLINDASLSFLGDTSTSGLGVFILTGNGAMTLSNSASDVYIGILQTNNIQTFSPIHLNSSSLHIQGNSLFQGTGNNIGPNVVIDGTGGVEFSGSVPTDIRSVNTYTGGTTISSGTVTMTTGSSLAPTCPLSMGANGTFDITQGSQTIGPLSGTASSGVVSIGIATLTVNTSGTSTYPGVITGSSGKLTVQGTGNLILTNAGNTYAGGTTIASGATLSLADSGAVPAGTITMNGAATFDVSAIGAASYSVGNQRLSANSTTSVLHLGTVNLIATITDTETYPFAITGTSASVTQNGSGQINLTNIGNTFAGGLNISTGTIALTGVGSLTSTCPVTLSGNGTFDISGITPATTLTIGPITSTSTDTIKIGTIGLISNTVGTTTFAGVITGTSGSLTVQGTGNLVLTNANNTFSGGATIQGSSTLSLAGTGNLPAGLITLNDSAIFDISGISPATSFSTGTFAGTSALTSVVIGTKNLILNTTAATTFAGVITGTSGSLTVQGAGNLILTNAGNTYSGGTVISSGTLSLAGAGALPSGGTIQLDGTGILDISGISASSTSLGNIASSSTSAELIIGTKDLISNSNATTTFAAAIIGTTGSLTQSGIGNLILTNPNNTYTGGTIISSGTLSLADAGALNSTGSVSLTGAGIFDIQATNYSPVAIGTLSGVAGSAVFMGTQSLTINTTETSTFAGILSGSTASLTVEGTGNLILTDAGNNYTGGTTINSGTLSLVENGAIDPTGNVAINGSGTFDVSGISPASSVSIGTLAGNSSNATFNLGTISLVTSTAGTSTYAGVILGTTAGLTQAGTGNLILTNAENSFAGGTLISAGKLSLSGNGSLLSTGNVIIGSNSTFDISNISSATAIGTLGSSFSDSVVNIGTKRLTINTTTTSTYAGIITGTTGPLTVSGTGTLILTNGGNTYRGGTTLNNIARLLLADSGALTPSGTMTLNGNSTFDISLSSVPVQQIGPLSSSSLGTTVALGDNTLQINETTNSIFAGTFTGSSLSNLIISGSKLLNLTGNSSNFSGLTTVNGSLTVNGTLGDLSSAPLLVNSGGTLSGIGSTGRVTVSSGGSISPGNSIGTFNVVSYTNSGGNYLLEIDKAGNSDLINSSGAVVINGGKVIVIPVDGQYLLNHTYIIVNGASVTGTYSGAQFLSNLSFINPALLYDQQHVYLTISTNIANAATNCNQLQVAQQLDSILHPTTQQNVIITAFTTMTPAQAQTALNSLTGEQHTDDLLTTQITNRQFIRRLYDPIRSIVTANGDFARCWGLFYNVGCNQDIKFWAEAGGSRTHLNSEKNTYGITLCGFNVTLGIQKTVMPDWTIGIAGSCVYDRSQYTRNAKGKSTTDLLGVYTLYRPAFWYGLADITWGNSTSTLNRNLTLNTVNYHTHCNPNINQWTFYGELGCDLKANCFLIQPFAGLELNSYIRGKIQERSDSGLQLLVNARYFTTVYARSGLHITTYRLPYNTFASVDFAWIKKLSNKQNIMQAKFVQFGNQFNIAGTNLDNNSFEGSLTLSSKYFRDLRIYSQATGEIGFRFYSYNVQGGLEFLW